MKVLLLLLLAVTAVEQSYAQDSIYNAYWKSYIREIKEANDKAVKRARKGKKADTTFVQCKGNGYLTNSGFNQLSKQLFAKVIVGMDGLPKEGTASSLAIDDETSKLGGNVNFSHPKTPRWLYNIGVSGNASSNQVALFTENSYQKGFKLSGGINYKIRSSIIYDSDSCHKVLDARNTKFIALINKIYEYRNVDAMALERRIDSTRDSISPIKNPDYSVVRTIDIDRAQKRLAAQLDSLYFIATYIRQLGIKEPQEQSDSVGVAPVSVKKPGYEFKRKDQVDSIIKAEVSQFEVKNAITLGYKMHWLSFNYSFANNAYNVFDTSVTRIFSEATKKQAYGTSTIGLSYNYGRITKSRMLFFFVGIAAGNRYALEDLKLQDDSLVGKVGVYIPELSIKAIDVTKFAEVYNLRYNYLLLQAGGFVFFGEKKIIGVELYASVRAKHKTPELIDHKPAYTVRFGPLFSMTKDKGVVSNGTLGLMLQSSEFTPSRNNIDDRFSFAVRLSIPFSNLKYL